MTTDTVLEDALRASDGKPLVLVHAGITEQTAPQDVERWVQIAQAIETYAQWVEFHGINETAVCEAPDFSSIPQINYTEFGANFEDARDTLTELVTRADALLLHPYSPLAGLDNGSTRKARVIFGEANSAPENYRIETSEIEALKRLFACDRLAQPFRDDTEFEYYFRKNNGTKPRLVNYLFKNRSNVVKPLPWGFLSGFALKWFFTGGLLIGPPVYGLVLAAEVYNNCTAYKSTLTDDLASFYLQKYGTSR